MGEVPYNDRLGLKHSVNHWAIHILVDCAKHLDLSLTTDALLETLRRDPLLLDGPGDEGGSRFVVDLRSA